ncbi:MAG: FAD-linked oxidase C-terminal domain-containing protein [Bacteroidota bacterium]
MSSKPEVLKKLETLRPELAGELYTDTAWNLMYATDASAYREIPAGVVRPKHKEDIKKLILFASLNNIPLIPRTAGTSLAGQVVGSGLVVDVSKHMTSILEINAGEHWVRVEPGVILDELNKVVEKQGLFFGPETSTSSRCMIGGMVGNNSCGAHSILYGSTRDHVLSVSGFLSDGSEVEFTGLSLQEFEEKCQGDTLENKIYRQMRDILSDPSNQEEIRSQYPDPAIHRRNTGYAIDLLLETEPFSKGSETCEQYPHMPHASWLMAHDDRISSFNFCKLIAGSEGTLMFMTEIKLNLVPLPPKQKALVCVHCNTIAEALQANLIALRYAPGSVELMDKAIMDCTKDNITQRWNRFFIEGDPGAILIVEFARETRDEITDICRLMEAEMRDAGFGYHFPMVFPPELKRVWDLRKAGLGVLSNYPGDRKPVPVTEDTAVSPSALPGYIRDFDAMLAGLGLNCVYYAHVGSGELHLRPVLNLKDPADVELFHTVALETAKIVKKYHGSLSGEHGDGRLRGEFIPLMIGDHNYALLEEIKKCWDPGNIFNPNKIVGTPKMNSSLRYEPGAPAKEFETYFDFTSSHGILRAAEQCNGSADCRNNVVTGKWMCPSYMAMGDENSTTRARANILREFLTNSTKSNPFDHAEIYMVMDLCLSCKACKSECPSNVDIAKLKAEFLQHYYDSNGIPLRSRLIAYISSINRLGSMVPGIFNFFQKNSFFSAISKKMLGFAGARSIPLLHKTTLKHWLGKNLPALNAGLGKKNGSLYLFVDEFSNYNDVETGIKTVLLFNHLGYEVLFKDHDLSGRTFLSKGLIRKARTIAANNIRTFSGLVSPEVPLVGIEPSAILGFRDEYPDLAGPGLREQAVKLSGSCFLYDEFIMREVSEGRISPMQFTSEPAKVKLHGHCHQKALASTDTTLKMLSLPVNYSVEEIKSGCCGMAGAFGYEKEHYEVSMKVGELVLFPEIRKTSSAVIIAAAGTSCRHQIKDGTGRKALHPAEVLFDALSGRVYNHPGSPR